MIEILDLEEEELELEMCYSFLRESDFLEFLEGPWFEFFEANNDFFVLNPLVLIKALFIEDSNDLKDPISDPLLEEILVIEFIYIIANFLFDMMISSLFLTRFLKN